MSPQNKKAFENRIVRLECAVPSSKVVLKNARVSEGLSRLTETRVEILCNDKAVDLQDFIGKPMTLVLDEVTEHFTENHYFSGTCVSVEFVGYYQGDLHLVAEVRPWLWFLTKKTDSRIFQEKSAPDIIKEILGDYGFSSDIIDSLTGTYKLRTYCVQYRETDFDFICRLMEEEGIYYYFKQDGDHLRLVLADSISAHSPVPNKAEIPFFFREGGGYRRDEDHIFEWSDKARITSGKVTLDDFDFTKPSSDLKTVKSIAQGTHSHKNYELYDYPGHYRETDVGDSRAKVRMEAEAVRHKRSRGVGNVRGLRVGTTFTMKDHDRTECNGKEFLTVAAVHHLKIETDYEDAETRLNPFLEPGDTTQQKQTEEEGGRTDTYRCEFETIPSAEPFRAPQETRWPAIAGLHTAIVTGPSGEEIYTDEYGRIKVQFHWDRQGQKNEQTTCWVRCVMPWTGKNWGMISIPRIGQEVVVQFEEGDPDRPICTGMLYNAETKPPYTLPDNMTQTGIVTRSTKQGSAKTFNELIFEDKKDAEFVRMQSEKDYKQIVKNNAEIEIGLEKKDDGDLTQTIHRNKTETLKTGDHTFTVEDGNQTVFIKRNHTETIEGTCDQTITGDTTQTITKGNLTRTVEKGNEAVTISKGNYSLDTPKGSIAEEADKEILLKVGQSSIKIDKMGITIKGGMIKIEGTNMLDAKAPMSTVKGDTLLILKGGTTMIN